MININYIRLLHSFYILLHVTIMLQDLYRILQDLNSKNPITSFHRPKEANSQGV